MRGRFITFEGIEGAGKSTQVVRLGRRLASLEGRAPLVTREPGGTPMGQRLRAMLLDPVAPGTPRPGPLTEALLMVADRHEHVAAVIRPALEAGRTVLCDRFSDSTLAYQGGGSGVDFTLLRGLNELAAGDVHPHVTVLLDLEVSLALGRLAGRTAGPARADRFESESLAFHERVRATYLALAAEESGRFVVVDAGRDPEAVAEEVFARVQERVPA